MKNKTEKERFEMLLKEITDAKKILEKYSATGNWRDFRSVGRKLDAAIAEASKEYWWEQEGQRDEKDH